MSDAQPPAGLAPPAPPPTIESPPAPLRDGQLTAAWRITVTVAWVGAFLAYLGVWKASEEIGIATWWLGPRSNPQPIWIRLVPFAIIAVVGILASYNVGRLPWIGLGGSIALAVIAAGDFSRSGGLATIEFAIAGAVALVSLGSFSGVCRAAAAAGDP